MHSFPFRIKVLALSISALISFQASGQRSDPPFLKFLDHPWVDSVLNSLSAEEKIAQLIWVAAFADGDLKHEAWLNKQVTGE